METHDIDAYNLRETKLQTYLESLFGTVQDFNIQVRTSRPALKDIPLTFVAM